MKCSLQSLPVEILYEVQLYALSEHLPLACHHLYDVYKHSSSFFRATYILARGEDSGRSDLAAIYSKALRYPICDQPVLDTLRRLLREVKPVQNFRIQIPRRLFRYLVPPIDSNWADTDHPLPFLRYLYSIPDIPPINTDADEGYALTRAVHAQFTALVKFLLDHSASPNRREALAIKVAIRQKNLDMVKILVEKSDSKKRKAKRRKLEDRVTLDSSMLKIAVMSNAKDIVEYLYREKNVLPDVQTLKKMVF
ncbi:hypothetical protein B0H34DRAFT_144703 [Crassisporium funariophilum]|nr:hypothetical protein B0H34DRAFT_144703 [Crassisporium funariophilum]